MLFPPTNILKTSVNKTVRLVNYCSTKIEYFQQQLFQLHSRVSELLAIQNYFIQDIIQNKEENIKHF